MKKVLAITCMRDEGPYILEWIAHHRAIGVTDFLIYANDSSDKTDEILTRLQEEGVITYVPIEVPANKTPQWVALKEAWAHPLCKSADWVIVMDVDEFINVRMGEGHLDTLFEMLPEDVDAITMQWRLFGNSNRVHFRDEQIINQFTQSAPIGYVGSEASYLFKTLFRRSGPFQKLGVHRPRQKPLEIMPKIVNAELQTYPDDAVMDDKRVFIPADDVTAPVVELNHYSLKSAHAFLDKVMRGLPSSRKKEVGLAYWVERNFNTVENTDIMRSEAVRSAELKELRSLPGLAALHKQSCNIHVERITQTLRSIDTMMLLRSILIAGSSGGVPETAMKELTMQFHNAMRIADMQS